MAVIWIKQSLRKRSEKEREQQTAKEEIAEIQDAVIELAEIVSGIIDTAKEADKNG